MAGYAALQSTDNNDSIALIDDSAGSALDADTILDLIDDNAMGGPTQILLMGHKHQAWAGGGEMIGLRRETDNNWILRVSSSDLGAGLDPTDSLVITLNTNGTNNRVTGGAGANVDTGEVFLLGIYLELVDNTNKKLVYRLYTSGDENPVTGGTTVDVTTIVRDSGGNHELYGFRRPGGNASAKFSMLAVRGGLAHDTQAAWEAWMDELWAKRSPAFVQHARIGDIDNLRAIDSGEVWLAGPAALGYATGKQSLPANYGTIGSTAHEVNTTFYIANDGGAGIAEVNGFNDPIDATAVGGSITNGSADSLAWISTDDMTIAGDFEFIRHPAVLEPNEVANPITEQSAIAPVFQRWCGRIEPSGREALLWGQQSLGTWARGSNDGAGNFHNSGHPNAACVLDAEADLCGGIFMVTPYGDLEPDGTAALSFEEAAAGNRFLFNYAGGAYDGSGDSLSLGTGYLGNINSNWNRFGPGQHVTDGVAPNSHGPVIRIIDGDEWHQAIEPNPGGTKCRWDAPLTAAIGILEFPGAGEYVAEIGEASNSIASVRTNKSTVATITDADTSVQSHTVDTANDTISNPNILTLQGDYSSTITAGMAVVNTTKRVVSKVLQAVYGAPNTIIQLDSFSPHQWNGADWSVEDGDQLEFGPIRPRVITMPLPAATDASTWRTIGLKLSNGFGIWVNQAAVGASGYIHAAYGVGGYGIIGNDGASSWEECWPDLQDAAFQSDFPGRSIVSEWARLYADALSAKTAWVFAPSGEAARHDELFADIRAALTDPEIIVWIPNYRLDAKGESEDNAQNAWRNGIYSAIDEGVVVVSTITDSRVGDGPQQLASGMSMSSGSHHTIIGAKAALEAMHAAVSERGLALTLPSVSRRSRRRGRPNR